MRKILLTATIITAGLCLSACDKLGTFDIKWTPPTNAGVLQAPKPTPGPLPETRDPEVDQEPAEDASSTGTISDDYGYSPGKGGYYPGRDRDQSRDSEGGNGRYKVDYDRR